MKRTPAFPENTDCLRVGMTLRDWFAGQCLIGQISNTVNKDDCKRVALVCYACADAMLAARDLEEGK